MKPTQTGIAVALALVVIILFFIFPGFSPFRFSPQSGQGIATSTEQTASTTAPISAAVQFQAIDEAVGTGATAAVGDTVTVNYVGSLENGTVFDASANHGLNGFTFPLGEGKVIKGWDEGIIGMKVGGKRHLIIPAALAYGDQAVGNVIPANSTLIFDVELLKVTKAGK